MSELVEKLESGRHPVVVDGQEDAKELEKKIDSGLVLVRFTGTRGGTVLGIPVERNNLDLSDVDFEKGVGSVELAGDITLDYVDVRCVANVDLGSMSGEGWLERRD